jgi:hypothetical protein
MMIARAEVSEPTTLSSGMMGDLETWPLTDLLVWLHQSRRTAVVRLGSGPDAGAIFMQDGELLRCEWHHLRGEEALIGLMGMKRGSFALVQRAVPEVQPNIRRSTPELLLQCTIALDESRHPHRA